MQEPTTSPDAEPFQEMVAGLDIPMFVVTAASGGERSGCLVGFSTQTSIDPPRFLVCISRANHTFGVAMPPTCWPCTCSGPATTPWPNGSAPGPATTWTSSPGWTWPTARAARRCWAASTGSRAGCSPVGTAATTSPACWSRSPGAVLRGDDAPLGYQDVTDVDPAHPA